MTEITIEQSRKVYQRIDDPRHGDCWKCVICTLLGLKYEDVPNYIEYDRWYEMAMETFKEHGYELTGMELFNPKFAYLEDPTWNVYENVRLYDEKTFDAIKPEYGINGMFMASVYSPNYTNANEHPVEHLHSVICDIDFNIIFDPQKEYENVVNYPYSKLIGYNGIRSIDIIRKIKA